MATATNPIPPGFRALTRRGRSLSIRTESPICVVACISRPSGPEFAASPITDGHWPVTSHLYLSDPGPTFAQAVEAGCTVSMPAPEEMKQRQEAAFGAG